MLWSLFRRHDLVLINIVKTCSEYKRCQPPLDGFLKWLLFRVAFEDLEDLEDLDEHKHPVLQK